MGVSEFSWIVPVMVVWWRVMVIYKGKEGDCIERYDRLGLPFVPGETGNAETDCRTRSDATRKDLGCMATRGWLSCMYVLEG